MNSVSGFFARWFYSPARRRPGRRGNCANQYRTRGGFTLIEVLVAVTLTLVMMAAVVEIFAIVGRSINNSRSTLEMSERLRATVNRLRLDLEGVTASMDPPARPEDGEGYFEYIEGPIGAVDPSVPSGYNTDEAAGTEDTTVGDRDDILQFTTRSNSEPFVGRAFVVGEDRTSIKSQVAEVAWFLRGTTLYRRVLLVSPAFDADPINTPDVCEAEIPPSQKQPLYGNFYGAAADVMKNAGFYNNYDLSVHWDANAGGGTGGIVCNTLADLTRRECRYAHPPMDAGGNDIFPYSLHYYNAYWRFLGLPTLQECSHAAWPFPIDGKMPYRAGNPAVVLNPAGNQFDAWVNPYTHNEIDPETGSLYFDPASSPSPDDPPVTPPPPLPPPAVAPRYLGPRVGEDVVLTNVLSFDVKAWDPETPVLLRNDGGVYTSLLPGDQGYLATLLAGMPTASYGAYVDLGYGYDTAGNLIFPVTDQTYFSEIDHYAAGRIGTSIFAGVTESIATVPRIYDTWSTHYEHDGENQDGDGDIDEGADGFDSNTEGIVGVVDDPGEREAPPPYEKPLRGIQVKIRVLEPDSRRVREVTIRHDFLNQ